MTHIIVTAAAARGGGGVVIGQKFGHKVDQQHDHGVQTVNDAQERVRHGGWKEKGNDSQHDKDKMKSFKKQIISYIFKQK